MQLIKPERAGAKPLFSFVVVADTHINEREGESTSHFRTNSRANARARFVFQEIAAMSPRPSFVVHLGDIVHPVPRLESFHDAVANYKRMVADLPMPVHLVAGNHDVGDKAIDWAASDQITDRFLVQYRECFGPDYYHFDETDTRFVILNAQLFNSGLEDEPRQAQWLQTVLASSGDRRLFVFMHYPPYILDAKEKGNYDNIDEPARSWLLELLRSARTEAVFAGHVHNFWIDRIGGGDYYTLPSTAFMRHDFTEFYRVAPTQEFGRGEVDKFGYFVVDVFEQGHAAYSIRTFGKECGVDRREAPVSSRYLSHPATSGLTGIGVEMRHSWTESMQIPATGGVQEFGRKWARNDYPLLGLWEMGCRLVKVPDIDVLEDASRRRMELLAGKGCNFIVTALNLPQLDGQVLRDSGVSAVELNLTLGALERRGDQIAQWRATTGIPIYLSKILSGDDSQYTGGKFNHAVRAGYDLSELAAHRELLRRSLQVGLIDGFTLRLNPGEKLGRLASQAWEVAEDLRCKVLVSVKLGDESVAKARGDDRGNAALVAKAAVLSRCDLPLAFVFDTFVDIDRGYGPRHGLLDRRFCPRPAANALRVLSALISGEGPLQIEGGAQALDRDRIDFAAGAQAYTLLIGAADEVTRQIQGMRDVELAIDLCSGEAFSTSTETNDNEPAVVLVRRL